MTKIHMHKIYMFFLLITMSTLFTGCWIFTSQSSSCSCVSPTPPGPTPPGPTPPDPPLPTCDCSSTNSVSNSGSVVGPFSANAFTGGDGWDATRILPSNYNLFCISNHHNTNSNNIFRCYNQLSGNTEYNIVPTFTGTASSNRSHLVPGTPNTVDAAKLWTLVFSANRAVLMCAEFISTPTPQLISCGRITLSTTGISQLNGLSNLVRSGNLFYGVYFTDAFDGGQARILCYNIALNTSCNMNNTPIPALGGFNQAKETGLLSVIPGAESTDGQERIFYQQSAAAYRGISTLAFCWLPNSTFTPCPNLSGTWSNLNVGFLTGGSAAIVPRRNATHQITGMCQIESSSGNCWDFSGILATTLMDNAFKTAVTGLTTGATPGQNIDVAWGSWYKVEWQKSKQFWFHYSDRSIHCFDWHNVTGSGNCQLPTLKYPAIELYTISADPTNDTCLFVNGNAGGATTFDIFGNSPCVFSQQVLVPFQVNVKCSLKNLNFTVTNGPSTPNLLLAAVNPNATYTVNIYDSTNAIAYTDNTVAITNQNVTLDLSGVPVPSDGFTKLEIIFPDLKQNIPIPPATTAPSYTYNVTATVTSCAPI